ncbi:MAG: muramidase, partial [Bacteroidota bacterium]
KCWLWYARYLATATPPNGWYRFDFWQYTDGVHGPDTTPVPGVVGHCDRDVFQGTGEELAAFWEQHGV